ncbi:hypothetical protein AB0D30_21100 [Streptomyces sp. NPDC048409]|uniref:hypothetical protein n=1 Tax=Streptomyces sp. NPDC048409 TaxID=3154723 RepID=UPI003430E330
MHTGRTTLVAVSVLAATLTACSSSEPAQGKAERASASSSSASKSPNCGPDSQLSQSDWIDQCSSASATPSDKPSDTELTVGDTFAYTDGIKVKVDSVRTITRWGEYDDKPDAGQVPFRVTFTLTNGTTKPYDLDNFSYDAQGATTGGETESLYVDADSKEMTGRLAPGRVATFTSEYSMAKTDGKTIVFTMTRMDDAWLKNDSAWLGEDPHWTGDIK